MSNFKKDVLQQQLETAQTANQLWTWVADTTGERDPGDWPGWASAPPPFCKRGWDDCLFNAVTQKKIISCCGCSSMEGIILSTDDPDWAQCEMECRVGNLKIDIKTLDSVLMSIDSDRERRKAPVVFERKHGGLMFEEDGMSIFLAEKTASGKSKEDAFGCSPEGLIRFSLTRENLDRICQELFPGKAGKYVLPDNFVWPEERRLTLLAGGIKFFLLKVEKGKDALLYEKGERLALLNRTKTLAMWRAVIHPTGGDEKAAEKQLKQNIRHFLVRRIHDDRNREAVGMPLIDSPFRVIWGRGGSLKEIEEIFFDFCVQMGDGDPLIKEERTAEKIFSAFGTLLEEYTRVKGKVHGYIHEYYPDGSIKSKREAIEGVSSPLYEWVSLN